MFAMICAASVTLPSGDAAVRLADAKLAAHVRQQLESVDYRAITERYRAEWERAERDRNPK